MKYTYKESGIEWLGNLPKHWGITKLKKHFKVLPSNVDKKTIDGEIDVKLCNYIDVYYNPFIDNSLNYMNATATQDEIKKFQLQVGDVIITKDSEDPSDIGVPAIVKEVFENLICGYHLSLIRNINNKIRGDFLFWLLKDPAIISQLHREATGITRWAIASRHVKNCIIPIPPIDEQIVISDFLTKTWINIEKIRGLKIGSSKLSNDDLATNQLKLLLDYRNSIIHECVTGKKQIFEGEIETKQEAHA